MTPSDNSIGHCHRYILGIGSNVPKRRDMVGQALEMLAGLDRHIRASEIYETMPLSGVGPQYANAVAIISIKDKPETLSHFLKEYEKQCGRDITARREGIVPIDIDIVYADGICVRPKEIERDYFMRGASQLGI